MTVSELLGFGGAALSGYAYMPQITHLVKERCSAGLSERAFTLWMIASTLMMVHAIVIGAVVFVLLGCIQIVSTAVDHLLRPPLPQSGLPVPRGARAR